MGCQENSSQLPENFLNEVDQLFAEWHEDVPGGAVAIINKGNIIYERYFGVSNMKTKVPFSKNTLTDIGSISKQITACLIAILEEKEMLSIEDDLRKYLPELPEYEETIKIKHLLFHTSGIKDYEALVMIQGLHYFGEHMTNQYVIDLMSKQKTLNFVPNAEFEYSNSNYILLAEIIERVSGKPLNDFAQEQLFKPLEMKQTFFHQNQGEDFENRAIGYEAFDSGFKKPLYSSHLIGDGGLFTTLSDMIKWDKNFYENKLGNRKDSLLKRMKYREPLSNGDSINMAFAQIFTPHPFGENSWSHGGSGGGYRSFYIRFEKPQFSVIVLSNSDKNNAFQKANEIVNLFFNFNPNESIVGTNSAMESKPTFLPIKEIDIEHFRGYYHDKNNIAIARIDFDPSNKNFIVSWLENQDDGYISLPINSATLAEVEDTNYRYKVDLTKGVLEHYEKDILIKTWKKIDSARLPIEQFEGDYYAAEVAHELTFEIVDNQLRTENIFLDSLTRVGNTTFIDKKTLAILTFKLDANNEIKEFFVDIPRGDRSLRNLQFRKQRSENILKQVKNE